MAISRAKTWSAGEVLTASDLNSEFNNILNNAMDLWSPATKAADLNGFELILDGDADTSITADTDDRIDFRLGAVDVFRMDGTAASIVNGIDFVGTATGTRARLVATGDTNIGISIRAKGSAGVVLEDGNGNEVLIMGAGTASAINEITVTNAAIGTRPRISPSGGDTDIGLALRPKGTTTVASVVIEDGNGNEILIGGLATASAVNEVTVTNAAAGSGPTISASGGDTDVTLNLAGKAAGNVQSTSRLVTTDGVASGTAKVVGGLAKAGVSAADSVTAAASNNVFVDFATTYAIPSNTLKSGSVLRARAMVRVSDASGADTLTVKLVLGATDLIATTAVDPGATTDLHIMEFEITSRAAPSAASSLVGSGRWITNTGGTIAHGTGLLGATNFATNGALTLKAAAKWSSNTASTACLLESFNVWIN